MFAVNPRKEKMTARPADSLPPNQLKLILGFWIRKSPFSVPQIAPNDILDVIIRYMINTHLPRSMYLPTLLYSPPDHSIIILPGHRVQLPPPLPLSKTIKKNDRPNGHGYSIFVKIVTIRYPKRLPKARDPRIFSMPLYPHLTLEK